MSETKEATPLQEGVEYVAKLTLTQVGGTGSLKIEMEKTPRDFLDGDPDELVQMPISFVIMDELVKGLLENTTEETPPKPEKKKPDLRIVH